MKADKSITRVRQHGCKPGDIVRNKNSESGELGIFIGLKTFGIAGRTAPYTCAEVMWFERSAPNGDVVSTIQANLIEAVIHG